MTNEFYILWFEDNTSWYNMQSRKVKKRLDEDYCLKTNIQRNFGSDLDLDELLTSNSFDLILMDYKLAAGNTGEKIINLIRNNSILTDILLYSSEYSEMTSSLLSLSNPLIDGVYFADRENTFFESKLYGLIQKIIRRSEDIINLRGFFLDNTSDFEVRITEILNICWQKLESFRDDLNSITNDRLDSVQRHYNETLIKIRKKESVFLSANKNQFALSIRQKLQILDKAIEYLIQNGHIIISADNEELTDFSNNYNDSISKYRNSLSHKKDSDTSLKIQGEQVLIDEVLHKQLRNNINRFDTLISYLEEIVVSL